MEFAEPTREELAAARTVFRTNIESLQSLTSRVFVYLLIGQWAFAIVCATVISPRTWTGEVSATHAHVWAAIVLGGALTIFPAALAWTAPTKRSTRLVVSTAQVMYSALLIHLTGGRIETHFHIFGSLAILSFYRDPLVFAPAVAFIFADHVVRGIFWPQSVFGVATVAPWRAFEHGGWVLFETAFLIWGVAQSRQHLWDQARLYISLMKERDSLEDRVAARTVEAREKQSHLDAVISSLPNAVFWQSPERVYLGCNAAFAKIFGLIGPEDIIGRTDGDLPWDRAESEPSQDVVQEVLTTGLPAINREEERTFANGNRRTIMASATPLLTPFGKLRAILGTYTDITDRKSLEQQLNQCQRLESIGQLAAGVAHEINTPMQCVGGNVEFLKNCCGRLFGVLDAYDEALRGSENRFTHIRRQVPAAIDEASDAVQRVIEIVRAMKAMSHPGAQEKSFADLHELIRSAAAISRNRWKTAATVEFDFDDSIGEVKLLSAEMSQVMLNLIVNAADAIVARYGEGSSELGSVVIRTRAEGDDVAIEVSDTGCGMSDDVKRRIFDPFFTTKDVGKGTGQGLAISYDVIVRKHGGSIEAHSVPGEGTTFVIRIPREPASAPSADDDRTLQCAT
jgi:PAS domain S-box-containing protein